MNKTLLIYACIMLFGTFISAISQVILKKAAGKTYENKIREYVNLPVISASSNVPLSQRLYSSKYIFCPPFIFW